MARRRTRLDTLVSSLNRSAATLDEAVTRALQEIAGHPRRSPKVEAFLESLVLLQAAQAPKRKRRKKAPPKKKRRKKKKPAPKPKPPRSPILVPYYVLEAHQHDLRQRGYKEGDPIAVNGVDRSGRLVGAENFILPARWGYVEEWADWRRIVRRWLRQIHAAYGYAVIE